MISSSKRCCFSAVQWSQIKGNSRIHSLSNHSTLLSVLLLTQRVIDPEKILQDIQIHRLVMSPHRKQQKPRS